MKPFKASFALALVLFAGCSNEFDGHPVSDSGVSKASTKVEVGSDNLTTEQRNIKRKLEDDNKPGAIKYLYVVSPLTSKIIMSAVVSGKVTSGGKRLTPLTVEGFRSTLDNSAVGSGFTIDIGGHQMVTREVLQDDGSYGSSSEYLYFWDTKGVRHQIYVGGCVVLVEDQPLNIPQEDLGIRLSK